ncbi:kinase-like domain-containing protein [Rhizophagus diaphanus]|nr:kinase-like domain-containing protein [Rhizophagus diaphanus] [Rhizophagus sp. MUCL 43196]
MTSFNEWIDMKINDGDIHYVEYNEFSCVKKVGEGSFGIVESADWKSRGIKIALKTLIDHSSVDENSMNKFVKELKNLKEASFHQNINKFFGISKEPLSNKYAMILEFANQGNLREYLKNSFKFLLWSDKIQMSLDIVSGLKYLHSKQIIHRDLHAKNILVDNNRLMIADFGTSKQLSESTPNSTNSTANGLGMAEYNEPQLFKIVNYKKDKKSDIYSLGSHISYLDIREKPIEGTPLEYQQLYQKCWNGDPDLRPDIDEVYEALSCISVPANQIQSLLTDLKPILGQIRPLFPPVLTPFDLLSNYTINLLSNCTISQFNALQAYRYACIP